MSGVLEAYVKIEKNFVEWAEKVDDIRAAFVVGSRARTDHPADEWSDLDIIVFTSNPQAYLDDDRWVKEFGNLWISFVTRTAGDDQERLNLYENGVQVDFVIKQERALKEIVMHKHVPDNFYRGVRVLIDKDKIAENIMPKQNSIPSEPDINETSFTTTVSMFWFAVSYIRRQLQRDELWVAKLRETDIRGLLYQMIVWHEKMVHGPDYDTWHGGRFLKEWVSKDIYDELKQSFGCFDCKDSMRALIVSVNLFRRLAHDIAEKQHYSYPYELEKNIMNWLR